MLQHKWIFAPVLLSMIPLFGQSQDFKLGAYFSPGIADRFFELHQADSSMLFDASDKATLAGEAGLVFQWYPDDKIHVEFGLQGGKKGFRTTSYGENKFLDHTGIDIIGDPPEKVVSTAEFYYGSLVVKGGYDVYRKKSLTAGGRAGLMFDTFLWNIVRQRATFSDRTENIIIHPDFEGLKRFNVSASASIYVNYVLSEFWEVSLEPQCSLSMLPSMKTDQFTMKFFNYGLRLSVYLLLEAKAGYRNPIF